MGGAYFEAEIEFRLSLVRSGRLLYTLWRKEGMRGYITFLCLGTAIYINTGLLADGFS